MIDAGGAALPEYYDEETIDLREYGQAILRRKWVLISIILTAIVSAAIASQFITPIFEATTTIMVEDKQPGAGQFAFLDGIGQVGKNTNQNYVEVLKSRSLSLRAAEILGRSYDPHSPEFADFKNSISVQLVANTDAIRIKVQSPEPEEAKDIANAVVDAFIERNQEVNSEEARSARTFIGSQLTMVEKDLQVAEEELRKYREVEKVVAPSEEGQAILSRLTELEKMQAAATVELDQMQRQLDELHKKLAAEEPTAVTSTTISSNPIFNQYKLRLSDLETQLTVAEQQYTANHPQVMGIRTEIASVQAQMAKEVERVVSAEVHSVNPNYQAMLSQVVTLEVESAAQKARQNALAKQITQVEKELGKLPEKEIKLTRLLRNQSVLEQVYLLLKNKHEEYKITEAVKAAGVHRLDAAITPQTPVKPRKKLNVAIAGVLGIFVGIGMVLVLEFLDTTLKTTEDIERHLGLPVLGRIPMVDANVARRSHRRSKKSKAVGM